MAKDRGKRGPANAAPLRSEDECTPASLGRPPLKRQARGRAVRTYCATWSTDYEHGWDLRLPEYSILAKGPSRLQRAVAREEGTARRLFAGVLSSSPTLQNTRRKRHLVLLRQGYSVTPAPDIYLFEGRPGISTVDSLQRICPVRNSATPPHTDHHKARMRMRIRSSGTSGPDFKRQVGLSELRSQTCKEGGATARRDGHPRGSRRQSKQAGDEASKVTQRESKRRSVAASQTAAVAKLVDANVILYVKSGRRPHWRWWAVAACIVP
ncbi:hypothetical protein UVI_02023770 [Ustilaginoidea virens]|uniref:Uncharacterized protein n=1 Tax=Ustilaginoidea virens TaxID=1159556 RepID=A0A1B5L0M8_USTVR|nr:hypothetical protein UVI_02023770 [Ustilaginoidea virens]